MIHVSIDNSFETQHHTQHHKTTYTHNAAYALHTPHKHTPHKKQSFDLFIFFLLQRSLSTLYTRGFSLYRHGCAEGCARVIVTWFSELGAGTV